VFEVEGLKGVGVGAIAPTPYFISSRLRRLRAIGFEVEVGSLLVHKLTTPVQRIKGRSFL